jgi:uncharacterized Fe-S cluster-containing MiaB family protein
MTKLDQKEIESLQSFINKYREIYSDIEKIEKEMIELEKKSGSLLEELEFFREKEKSFLEDLSKKYGEGNLNPLTLNWEI